jgi:pyruvate/2-oxoglutarate dehydrogenase complex dihydrolipoamide dehydrogenase (E3) component
MSIKYDVIVSGTGQSGLSVATELAGTGMKVIAIKRKLFGGTCVNIYPTVSELTPTTLGDLKPLQ